MKSEPVVDRLILPPLHALTCGVRRKARTRVRTVRIYVCQRCTTDVRISIDPSVDPYGIGLHVAPTRREFIVVSAYLQAYSGG